MQISDSIDAFTSRKDINGTVADTLQAFRAVITVCKGRPSTGTTLENAQKVLHLNVERYKRAVQEKKAREASAALKIEQKIREGSRTAHWTTLRNCIPSMKTKLSGDEYDFMVSYGERSLKRASAQLQICSQQPFATADPEHSERDISDHCDASAPPNISVENLQPVVLSGTVNERRGGSQAQVLRDIPRSQMFGNDSTGPGRPFQDGQDVPVEHDKSPASSGNLEVHLS